MYKHTYVVRTYTNTKHICICTFTIILIVTNFYMMQRSSTVTILHNITEILPTMLIRNVMLSWGNDPCRQLSMIYIIVMTVSYIKDITVMTSVI